MKGGGVAMEGEWKAGEVVCGDAVAMLRRLGDGEADMILADPPLYVPSGWVDVSRMREEYLGWSRRWIAEAVRVLRPWGAMWLCATDDWAAELKLMACQEFHLQLRSWVVWYHGCQTIRESGFCNSHRHVFYLVKPGDKKHKNVVFHADAVKVPSARQLVYRDRRAAAGGRVPDDTWFLGPAQEECGSHDTWPDPGRSYAGSARGIGLPDLALDRILRATTNEGDLVVELFAKTGRGCVLARRRLRRYLGCECELNLVRKAAQRVSLEFG